VEEGLKLFCGYRLQRVTSALLSPESDLTFSLRCTGATYFSQRNTPYFYRDYRILSSRIEIVVAGMRFSFPLASRTNAISRLRPAWKIPDDSEQVFGQASLVRIRPLITITGDTSEHATTVGRVSSHVTSVDLSRRRTSSGKKEGWRRTRGRRGDSTHRERRGSEKGRPRRRGGGKRLDEKR